MYVVTHEEFESAVNQWRASRSQPGKPCLCKPGKYVRPDGYVELYVGDWQMQGCPLHCKHLGMLPGAICECGEAT